MKLSSNQQLVDMLVDRVLEVKRKPTLVGINGKDGSGKTILANLLAESLGQHTNREIIRISIDDFMHERAYRKRNTQDEARGCYDDTFDYELFKQWALEPFLVGASLEYKNKIFDYEADSIYESNSSTASDSAIVIIDGVFLFKEGLRDYFDLKILLEVRDETSIYRGVQRDIKIGRSNGDQKIARDKYVKRYVASQKIYYNEANPVNVGDIVIGYDNIDHPEILKI